MKNNCTVPSTDLVMPKAAIVNIDSDEYGELITWINGINEPKQHADSNLMYQISVALTSFKNRVNSLIEQRRLFNSIPK